MFFPSWQGGDEGVGFKAEYHNTLILSFHSNITYSSLISTKLRFRHDEICMKYNTVDM